jgi:hypothetical protein
MPWRVLRGEIFVRTWRQPDCEFGELYSGVDMKRKALRLQTFDAWRNSAYCALG